MKEENIVVLFLCVDEIFNTINCLGENVNEEIIAKNVFRSLTLRFDSKISAIKKIKNLDYLTVDELHGILTTYEMRIEKDKEEKHSRK